MALSKIRLGDYIDRSTVNNKDLTYGSELNNKGIYYEIKAIWWRNFCSMRYF